MWEHYVPEIAFLLIYILAAVLCLAVAVMASYCVYGITCGETSVESQDYGHPRKMARGRGEVSRSNVWRYTLLPMLLTSGRIL